MTLLVTPTEADSLRVHLTLLVVSVIGLVVLIGIFWRSRDDIARSDAAMQDRVLAVLAAHEDEDPTFVAEARDLHGFLTPTAWITRVRTLASQSNLSPQARADLMAASPSFQRGAL